jgi:hypothetical protein
VRQKSLKNGWSFALICNQLNQSNMVLCRFNHDATSDLERWRVLVNGVEHTACNVSFKCETNTSKDTITLPDGTETIKYHIRAEKYKGVLREIKANGEVTIIIV